VIVAYQNQIVMDERLDTALEKIFSKGASTRPPDAELAAGDAAAPAMAPLSGDETVEALAELARQHFERAIAAQRNGEWARYGEEIAQVGAALERMTKKSAAPQPPPKK
jgi:hypothetical protein